MRHLLLPAFGLLSIMACTDDMPPSPVEEAAVAEIPAVVGYDSSYAMSVRADDYGMGQYVLALLRPGPSRDQDSVQAAELMRGHLDNMTRWADEGKLVLAGPASGADLRGIYVFDMADTAAVRAILVEDPAIAAGRLGADLYPWYASAALRDIPELHERAAKVDF